MTLATVGTGLRESEREYITLIGVMLSSGSQFEQLGSRHATFLEGVITNNGTMTLYNQNYRYVNDFSIIDNTTLSGSGVIDLASHSPASS